jgi:hypothetical protein
MENKNRSTLLFFFVFNFLFFTALVNNISSNVLYGSNTGSQQKPQVAQPEHTALLAFLHKNSINNPNLSKNLQHVTFAHDEHKIATLDEKRLLFVNKDRKLFAIQLTGEEDSQLECKPVEIITEKQKTQLLKLSFNNQFIYENDKIDVKVPQKELAQTVIEQVQIAETTTILNLSNAVNTHKTTEKQIINTLGTQSTKLFNVLQYLFQDYGNLEFFADNTDDKNIAVNIALTASHVSLIQINDTNSLEGEMIKIFASFDVISASKQELRSFSHFLPTDMNARIASLQGQLLGCPIGENHIALTKQVLEIFGISKVTMDVEISQDNVPETQIKALEDKIKALKIDDKQPIWILSDNQETNILLNALIKNQIKHYFIDNKLLGKDTHKTANIFQFSPNRQQNKESTHETCTIDITKMMDSLYSLRSVNNKAIDKQISDCHKLSTEQSQIQDYGQAKETLNTAIDLLKKSAAADIETLKKIIATEEYQANLLNYVNKKLEDAHKDNQSQGKQSSSLKKTVGIVAATAIVSVGSTLGGVAVYNHLMNKDNEEDNEKEDAEDDEEEETAAKKTSDDAKNIATAA